MAELNDLKLAYDTLSAKQRPYTLLWNYYDGDQPLVYSADRLREVFRKLDAVFIQNWCSVVIDAASDRIDLQEITLESKEDTTRFAELWRATEMNLDSDDAHKCALVTGESYVIAWKTEEGLEAYYNDSRLCHVFYEADNPRKKRFAAKWWRDEQDHYRLILYYEDRFEYYRSTNKAQNVSTHQNFKKERDDAENVAREIPVFHLRKERRANVSDLHNVIPLQDAINKLLADMMVQAEFGAFKQRYVISNADTGSLKNSPNGIWDIPQTDQGSHPAEVGEFSATELRNYYDAIDQLASSIAIITRTPKHYFLKQGGDPSGEALIAMEAPLVKKVKTYIERFEPVWQDVARFILKLESKEIDKTKIAPVFANPETIQPRTQSEIRGLNVSAGVPLYTTLRLEGWSNEEIEQLKKDKAEESAERLEEKQKSTEIAMKAFDRGAAPVE